MTREEFAEKWGWKFVPKRLDQIGDEWECHPIELMEDLDSVIKNELPPAEGAEEIAYKYELKDEDGVGTDCVFIDDTIKAMQEFAALTADKIAEERIREELIRYDDYRRGGERNYPYSARLVDEYLKSRKP